VLITLKKRKKARNTAQKKHKQKFFVLNIYKKIESTNFY
jgi:hypothetical protein